MFKMSYIGRWIVIKNTRSALFLQVGEEVQITAVVDSTVIRLAKKDGSNHNWQAEGRDWEFLEEDDVKYTIDKKFKSGDVVMVDKDYQTVKRGDSVTILEVVDDERITIDGCLPGGFIRIKDLVPKYDLGSLRLSTTDEILIRFGVAFGQKKRQPEWYFDNYGRGLLEAGCIQEGKKIYGPDGEPVPKYMIRKVLQPSPQAQVVIVDASNQIPMSERLKKLIGRDIKEVSPLFTHLYILRVYAAMNAHSPSGSANNSVHVLALAVKGGDVGETLPF